MDIIHKETPQVSRSGRMRIYLCNTCERERVNQKVNILMKTKIEINLNRKRD